MRWIISFAAATAALAAADTAVAASFVAPQSGSVTAYFAGGNAGDTLSVGLFVNGAQQGGYALPNHGAGNAYGASSGPVPEPASWAMMIAGFGLVGGTLRRRSARAMAFATA